MRIGYIVLSRKGEITMGKKEDKEKEDTRRLADLHLQAQIPVFAHRIGALEGTLKEFKGGITNHFDRIYDKINDLQCGVHLEKISNVEKNTSKAIDDIKKETNGKIKGLYVAFLLVFVIAIIVDQWMKRGG